MWSFFRPRRAPAIPTSEHRRQERFATHGNLRCGLGELTDLSVSGMRLVRHGRPPAKLGQVIALTIRTGKQQLAVQGRVVRLQRTGLRNYELGIQFVSLTPATIQALNVLARYGFVGRPAGATQAASPPPESSTASTSTSSFTPARASGQQIELYRLLDLSPGASLNAIRSAYRALAVKYHPDHNPDPAAQLKFQEIHQAYVALREAARRLPVGGGS